MHERSQQQAGTLHAGAELMSARPAAIRAKSAAEELSAFFDALIDHHCALTGGLAGAVYLLSGRPDQSTLFARRVAPGADTSVQIHEALHDPSVERQLVRIAHAASQASSEGARAGRVEAIAFSSATGLYQAGNTHRALAVPLVAEGRVQGATLTIIPEAEGDARPHLGLIELANQRFETFLLARHARAETEQKLMLRQTLELLDRAQQAPGAHDMATILCDEFQQRFGCTRVSIGTVQGDRLKPLAISGAPKIDRRTPIVEALEAAMEECAAQDIEILYPTPAEQEADPAQRRVTRRHEMLFDNHGRSSILSLPLRLEGDLVGVAILEREEHNPFPTGSVNLVRLAAEFIGPALWTRRLADRGVLAVVRDRAGELSEAAVGPRHTGWKILGVFMAVVLLGLSAVPIPSRVVSAGELVALDQRRVTPPFSTFLADVLVRPGDRVEQGQILAKLDTSDLTLRLAETEAQLAAAQTERDNALTVGERTEAAIAQSRADELSATIDLIRDRLARSNVTAPIGGRIAQGDLNGAIGSRIETGQVMFEIVGDQTRAVLEVRERDIGRLEVGDEGWISTRSKPSARTGVRVVRINPVAEAGEGSNAYRVEAELTEPADWLRAGMRITARIKDGGTVPILELTRPLIDEARLRLWW